MSIEYQTGLSEIDVVPSQPWARGMIDQGAGKNRRSH
jgi:hypothetical protein